MVTFGSFLLYNGSIIAIRRWGINQELAMPNLFTSLGRAAFVAIGLTIAASASAQIISCPAGFNTVVSGAGTASVQITCQAVASCGSGEIATVTGAGTNQATVTCGTGTPVVVAPGGSTGSGCSLNATVTSGAAGFGTTLTASCTSGTTPVTLAWSTNTGASVANCPTSMAGLSTTCDVTGIAQSGNFTVNFSNSAGNNNKSRSVTVQSGGGGSEYSACEKTPTVSTSFYPATNTTTSNIGELNDSTLMVIKFTVPSSAFGSNQSANFSSVYGGDATRDFVLSTSPCDWAGTNAVKYNGSKVMGRTYSNLTFKYSYGSAGSTATLIRGSTYYLTIRGVSGCPSGDCFYSPVNFK